MPSKPVLRSSQKICDYIDTMKSEMVMELFVHINITKIYFVKLDPINFEISCHINRIKH